MRATTAARSAFNFARTAAEARASSSGSGGTKAGITLSEACQILNVRPPQAGKTDMKKVMDRFKRLYDLNEPEQGGSFYLQSKVLMARERIEAEVYEKEEEEERERELSEGWKPRLYKR